MCALILIFIRLGSLNIQFGVTPQGNTPNAHPINALSSVITQIFDTLILILVFVVSLWLLVFFVVVSAHLQTVCLGQKESVRELHGLGYKESERKEKNSSKSDKITIWTGLVFPEEIR